MKKRKIIQGLFSAVFAITAILITPSSDNLISLSTTSYAASNSNDIPNPPSKKYTGFSTSGKNTYYYENGVAVVSKTKKINGKIYLFDSKGRLKTNGIHTVNKNKYYSDKDGVVTCNKWLKMTDGSYYYASSSGKLKKYQFVEKKYQYISGSSFDLYIDDKEAQIEDLGLKDAKNVNWCYLKINNDYYHVALHYLTSGTISITNMYGYSDGNYPVYDLATGKYLGNFYGQFDIDPKTQRVNKGKLFNNKENKVYTFSENKSKPTISKASPFMIYYRGCPHNSVGGMGYYMNCYNNSDKTIKYVYLNVYVLNRVNDVVRCDITKDVTFNLKLTGPIDPGDTQYAKWDAFMYNNSAQLVKVSSVTVEYMDGTKVNLSPSDYEFGERLK